MNIVLDAALEPTELRRVATFEHNLGAINAKVTNKASYNDPLMKCLTPLPADEEGVYPSLGFIEMLSKAYSSHRAVVINPQDIWFIVLCEVAKIIKKYPGECRSLFTKSDDVVTIKVPTSDPTQIDLEAVVKQLESLMPVGTSAFLPELSTMVPAAKIALNAALCDGVQVYYNYMTYCCGIPEIKVNGTVTDWASLTDAADSIACMFLSVELKAGATYMNAVWKILHDISDSVANGAIYNSRQTAQEFWKNIFTQENIGSGGELKIDGWITDLFFDPPKLKKIENYTTSVAVVPYENAETGRKFKGAYGAFQFRDVDGFLESEFTSFIFE